MGIARPGFTRPDVPAKFRPEWLSNQFGKLQQAIPAGDRKIYADSVLVARDDLSVVYCDATDAPIDFTLGDPTAFQWIKVWLIKTDVSANAVTLVGTVSGVVNPTLLAQYNAMLISSDGVEFFTLAVV